MKQGNSYTRIFRHTSLFAGVQGLNILVGLVRTKFAAVLLGPAGMGLLAVYNTASTLLQSATNFGIQTTGVREISVAYQDGDEEGLQRGIRILRSWSMVLALFGFFVTIALSGLLSRWAFSDGSYTRKFALLAPVVALAAVSGCEIAILKATRRLSQLATVSVVCVAASLVTSVPLYLKWGNEGIIPSLIALAVVQMAIIVCWSYRFYPLRLRFGKELRQGKGILVLGTAFVLAGICGSGAEFMIRAFLSDMSLSLAGLYNTGYMITMTYAGMMFTAMETDYFPFLSSVCHDRDKMNGAVNRQIEVSMVMLAPCLVLLMTGLPIIIPLLFSGKFLPVVGMTQVAVLAMYCRATYLPVAYILLAKADSRPFFLLELASAVIMVVAVMLCFYNWGLAGTGIALVVASAVDCIIAVSFCTWRYGLELQASLVRFILLQLAVAVAALCVVKLTEGVVYWAAGLALVAVSAWISVRRMRKRVSGE
ncbi:MAG: oligosaccharide flippase family protein [Prevotella sp.]|nr:oligosaccharide flippase family protein [Prevotella sp.]